MGQPRMDNPEIQATFGTQGTGRRQKRKKRNAKEKTKPLNDTDPRCSRRVTDVCFLSTAI